MPCSAGERMAETDNETPTGGGGGGQHQQAVADLNAFCTYLGRIVPVMLEDCITAAVPEALKRALSEKSNQESIRKFLSDPQVPILLIQRSSPKGNATSLIS